MITITRLSILKCRSRCRFRCLCSLGVFDEVVPKLMTYKYFCSYRNCSYISKRKISVNSARQSKAVGFFDSFCGTGGNQFVM